MSNEDIARIEANLEVIREYVIGQFKGFELIDKSDGPFGHLFTVTRPNERYKLKVSWA